MVVHKIDIMTTFADVMHKIFRINNSLKCHPSWIEEVVNALEDFPLDELNETEALDLFVELDLYFTRFKEIALYELPKLAEFWHQLEPRISAGIERRKEEARLIHFALKRYDETVSDDKVNMYENFDWYRHVDKNLDNS